MTKIECFKIQILKGDTPFEINKKKIIKQILCGNKSVFKEPKTILADPFLFVYEDILYLFYEDKEMNKNGVISMVCTRDLHNWSESIVVLKETCHLSYPWVFEKDGHVYMIPETCGMKEIRLYEGTLDLTSFNFVKTIICDDMDYENGFSYSDSSIYEKDDNYYLMTTVNDGDKNILKLYVSDRFDGEYKEHPQSPICVGNKYGRNAGCLFTYDNKLYRVAQNCEIRYGDNLSLLEVKEISPSKYEEIIVKNDIIPTDLSFFREGGHQFNVLKFNDEYVIALDAKEYHYFIINRIFYRLGLYK